MKRIIVMDRIQEIDNKIAELHGIMHKALSSVPNAQDIANVIDNCTEHIAMLKIERNYWTNKDLERQRNKKH